MNYGFIYCLENRAFPGIYKVGMTERSPSTRCDELSSSTSIPHPFEILFYMEVESARTVEAMAFSLFDAVRVNASREFFKLDPIELYESLKQYAMTDYVSPDFLLMQHRKVDEVSA
ncbi:GIY-YIG nuclease family protein [Pseudomonas nitroreducens]|uniref:GIY-YIG nuclease family protein n=1 Tax=Pseudomonas nitroreducens TaxID=46680 RepID=A0A6G6IUT1_PSENT|nr:GIY-YIG nuclease family protein [Pseudomonas nitroreducens]QIE86762.1 GIY-YIG nuclease family protein [Pseudomonas nitroreducens]